MTQLRLLLTVDSIAHVDIRRAMVASIVDGVMRIDAAVPVPDVSNVFSSSPSRHACRHHVRRHDAPGDERRVTVGAIVCQCRVVGAEPVDTCRFSVELDRDDLEPSMTIAESTLAPSISSRVLLAVTCRTDDALGNDAGNMIAIGLVSIGRELMEVVYFSLLSRRILLVRAPYFSRLRRWNHYHNASATTLAKSTIDELDSAAEVADADEAPVSNPVDTDLTLKSVGEGVTLDTASTPGRNDDGWLTHKDDASITDVGPEIEGMMVLTVYTAVSFVTTTAGEGATLRINLISTTPVTLVMVLMVANMLLS